MPGIDYSKWDRLNYSSSSTDSDANCSNEEEENGVAPSTAPRSPHPKRGAPEVTRLEYPSRITLGPTGVHVDRAPPKASANPFAPASSSATAAASQELQRNEEEGRPSHSSTVATAKGASAHASTRSACPAAPSTPIDAADDDEDLLYTSLARDGGREGDAHWWSQTEDTATVSLLVPWETTAKCVTHFRLHEEKEEGGEQQYHAHLDVTIQLSPTAGASSSSTGTPTPPSQPQLLEIHRQFRYPIKLAEDLVEGCWQLHRMPQRHLRLLVVQVFKEPIGVGMTLWWDRCFVTDTTSIIDTQSIPDRVKRLAAAGPEAAGRAEQFTKVWAEAHEEFRRRMQERKARSI